MPTIAELLKENGVDLTGVSDDFLDELVEKSDKVSGLVKSKNDLLAYKTETAPKMAQFETDDAARKLALETALTEKIEAAKQAGEWETVFKAEQDKVKLLNDRISTSNEATRTSTHEATVTQIQSMFKDATYGRDVALNRVSTTLNDEGSVIQKFTLGDKEFDSVDGLKAAMAENQSYASMMAAPNSGGGNTGGNSGGGKQNLNSNPDADAAQEKGDLTAFLQASLKGN